MRVFVAGATTGGLVNTETDPLDPEPLPATRPSMVKAAEQDRAA